MASIAFTVTMTDGTTLTRTAAVADTDVGRLLAWAADRLPQQNDASGNPLPRTTTSLVAQWIDGFVADTFARVHAYETDTAAQQAAAAIVPIGVTLT